MRITRLAPSPTGALHLGNARTFLATWLIARQRGWKIVLRVEDLDGPRIKPEAAQQAIDDLRWLGLDWDGDVVYQSQRLAEYGKAIERLCSKGLAYPCTCTRKEIELAASAPHASDGSTVYPGTCRDRYPSFDAARATGRPVAVRIAMRPYQSVGWGGRGRGPESVVLDGEIVKVGMTVLPGPLPPFTFVDEFAGPKTFDIERQIGDFVLAKPDGTPSYQLAVVVDDIEAGVTDVIRGDDLLDSVPRQDFLYRLLYGPPPRYWHLPLVVGEDGRRLAKRHGDTRLSAYREAGVSAGRVRALLGRWFGLPAVEERSVESLLSSFSVGRVAKTPIVMTGRDDAFLRGAHVG
jgi:glutamyl-tRNA synthetase